FSVGDHDGRIDAEFAALPLRNLADAALDAARTLGADHADFRVERVRGQRIALSDGKLESLSDGDDSGPAARVIVDGTWGFAAAVDLTPEAARDAARHAVEVAKVAAAMNTERIDLAPAPGSGDVTWVAAYEVDPFTVSPKEKIDLLAGWSARALPHPAFSHADASVYQVKECKFYPDGSTTATQQRVRLHPELTATAVTETGFDDMRTLAPPAGRGWEDLTSPHRPHGGWNFPP